MLVTLAVLLSAAAMAVFGFWAYVAPHSFADFIDYAPFNEHLLHDVGAFQIGIGFTLLAALVERRAVVVALAGFVVASGLHTWSHWSDRDLGGHDSDVVLLGLLTLVALAALLAVVLAPRRHR